MSDRMMIGAADLRRAVADERYWNSAHPERAGYVGWVTEGYRALHGPDANGGVVQVRAYTRTVDGHVQHVRDHMRGAPTHGEGETDGPIRQAQAPFFLFARPPIIVPPPRTPRLEMRRIPNQSGKEAARDVPSFAHGARRFVGENPTQFAQRIMNGQYREGGWSLRNPRQKREFSQIRKFGERAFEAPSVGGTTIEGLI